jgi:raffinose/stachyose/melibiose transport system substrate-binding protein
MLKRLVTFLFGLVALAGVGSVWAEGKAQITIESWRNDDLKIWRDTILPAFVKKHPEIEVVFSPTAPTEYNAVLDAKLKAGTAGDLVACRPFDKSLGIFSEGQLVALNDLPGIENFSEVAKAAWSTDDGKTTFAVPMASVIHGFFTTRQSSRSWDLACPGPKRSSWRYSRRSRRMENTFHW